MTLQRCFDLLFLGFVALVGCAKSTDTRPLDSQNASATQGKSTEVAPAEAKIQAALAKLSDADRPLALAQKFCPIEKTRLGSMGKPERIDLDGQPVFLCCSGCAAEARKNPKGTLDKVAELKREK